MTNHHVFTQTQDYQSSNSNRHAIVMGGSMAGLLAARILSDHFDRVTLIERDCFPEGAENRKGVPQGRHAHGLLAKGREIISRLFPDLIPAMTAGGASLLDIAADARWYHFGGFKVRFQSGFIGPFMSRPFLEWHVRQRVLALKNLSYIDECDVIALVATGDNSRITGVRITPRAEDAGPATLTADLVVDATGRGSQSPRWLEMLGYGRPEEEIIKVNAGYTSRIYKRRPGDLRDAKAVFILPTPPGEKRMGALFPIEGNRWLVSLGGWLGDHAPADEQGYLEFARSLPAPDIYNVIKQAEPLTDFAIHKFPGNLRRRYEKMAHFPEGYVVTGDAMCSFNPIYGQGMTVSALEAEALDTCLKERRGDLRDLPRRFFKRAAKVVDVAWLLAAGEDFRYPEAEGVRPPGVNLINWYISKVHRLVTRDPEIYRAFLKVMNMTHPPTLMFDPRMVLRVIKRSLTGGRATERVPQVRQHPGYRIGLPDREA